MTRFPRSIPTRSHALAALLPLTLLATGCGTDTSRTAAPTAAEQRQPQLVVGGDSREVAAVTPRALVAHDDTLTLIDTATGETLTTASSDGFVRLSDAGDGRHVVVADGDTFRVFDTGITSAQHGDHAHHHEYTPGLSPVTHDAPGAGHAVPHEGWTALFSDGTGEIEVLRTDDLTTPDAPTRRLTTGAAHHGVAMVLDDDAVLHTIGTADERRTVAVTRDGTTLARTDACPGVHGEAAAAHDRDGDVVVLGCTDGPVVLRGGTFHKVKVDDDYARTGNLAGHPDSPVVLTDYKTDPDADLERPTRIALVDTRDATLRTVDLGDTENDSYWFRSLGRGPAGEALVLTYDGSIRVLDPETGRETDRIPTIQPWTENDDWQQPGPVLEVVGDTAYVSDAAASELVVVDLTTGSVDRRLPLPHGVTELVVTDGVAPH